MFDEMFIQDGDQLAWCRDRHRGIVDYVKDCESDSISVWVFIGLAIAIIALSILASFAIVRVQDARARRRARRQAILRGDVRENEEADVESYQDNPIENDTEGRLAFDEEKQLLLANTIPHGL